MHNPSSEADWKYPRAGEVCFFITAFVLIDGTL
jgi:hypothetical protein